MTGARPGDIPAAAGRRSSQNVGSTIRVMSAVDAAVAIAEAHGVRCEKPVVLGEAWHALGHLLPSPVVARVTSGAPGVDPDDFERELAVARHAARGDAPVVRPSD